MTQPTGFRDWARLIFGPEHGDKMADDFTEAVGREFDRAIIYGTDTTMRPTTPPPPPAASYVPTEAERLGLLVGAAYGEALAERDDARALAETIGARYAEALTHLEAVLATSPAVATFAGDDDTLTSAREFLARAVESSGTPEQES